MQVVAKEVSVTKSPSIVELFFGELAALQAAVATHGKGPVSTRRTK